MRITSSQRLVVAVPFDLLIALRVLRIWQAHVGLIEVRVFGLPVPLVEGDVGGVRLRSADRPGRSVEATVLLKVFEVLLVLVGTSAPAIVKTHYN